MKFNKLLIFLVVIICISTIAETKRIRKYHSKNRRGIGTNLLELFAGFVSGLSGADGADINECLPENWRSNTLRGDTSDTLPAQFDANSLGAFKYVYYVVKWALDVACIFSEQLLKYFKMVRRRMRRRRLFIQRMLRRRGMGIGDWFADKWNKVVEWGKEKWESFKNWVSGIWNDVKEWTSEQLERVKDWAKETWENFKNGINSAVEKVKNVYKQVKDFVTSESFINGITRLINCAKIAYSLIKNIINVVKAIIAIVSGNVVQWAVMIVSLICNAGELYKAVQIAIAIFENGKPWYYTGKLVGHLLNIFGSTVSAKDTEEEVKKGTPSTLQKIIDWIKEKKIIEVGSATYNNYQAATDRPRINNGGYVQDGQTIVIVHKKTNKSLHSHNINYSGGSKQQEVTGFDGRDDNDLWTINHFNRGLVGTGFRNGDVVTLVHKLTGKTLHSHDIKSPITNQQEVSAYHERDTNDNWRLDIEDGDKYLKTGVEFRLVHINTGKYLHSHPDRLRDGSQQQEVTAYTIRDDNDYWKLEKIARRLRRRH